MKVLLHKNVAKYLNIPITRGQSTNFWSFVNGVLEDPIQWMIQHDRLPDNFIGTATMRELKANYSLTDDEDSEYVGMIIHGTTTTQKVWEIEGTGAWADGFICMEMSEKEVEAFKDDPTYHCGMSPGSGGDVVIYLSEDIAWL